MIVVSTDAVKGYRIKKVLGLVQGNSIRSRHLGMDLTAAFKNLTGGEITEYTKLIAEAREQALDRMRESAAQMGANSVLCVRFVTSSLMQGASELLVYGTAAIIETEEE
jgi:uncharacterized protein YbjQ (UPF0145 family)